MHIIQRPGHLDRDFQALLQIPQMSLFDGFPKAFALQKLHHDERTALFLAEIVDADDVLVIDAGGGAGFQQKSRLHLLVGRARGSQNFQGDATAQHAILGAIDMGHAAAQELLQLVFSDSGRMFHQRVTVPTPNFSVDAKRSQVEISIFTETAAKRAISFKAVNTPILRSTSEPVFRSWYFASARSPNCSLRMARWASRIRRGASEDPGGRTEEIIRSAPSSRPQSMSFSRQERFRNAP